MQRQPIDVIRAGRCGASGMAAHSRRALDGPLAHEAELWVALASDAALLLGAFQRPGPALNQVGATLRRGSGGPAVLVAEETLHVALRLARPGALTPCDPSRIVNRYVRPLLRALTRTGSLAHYGGRDWISVAHQPVAWVGFAHDSSTQRALFEAFVGIRAPFAREARASFLGKLPSTLESLAGRRIDSSRLVDAIVDAYAAAYGAEPLDVPLDAQAADGASALAGDGAEGDDGADGTEGDDGAGDADPPWASVVDEAIGLLGAGPDAHGVLRVGGDLLVSRDALRRLEARVAGAADEEVGGIVDAIFTAPGVALDGVRRLDSIRDVIVAARRSSSAA